MTVIGKVMCDVCKQEIVFMRYVCADCQRELSEKAKKHLDLKEEIKSRVEGFGYPVLIFLFAVASYLVLKDYGWPIAIFIFVLEIVIYELTYRLSQK